MYIPIMKNRDEEIRVIRTMNEYFNDSIIPLIEIYRDFYLTRYKTDETGDFVREKKQNSDRKYRIKLPPTEDDIITLKKIEDELKGKKAFIDFFRFNGDEYDSSRSFKDVELSIHLSRNFAYYKTRMIDIGNYANLIPVISIKEGFNISEFDLIQLINKLKESNSSIALRVTDGFFDDFEEVFEDYLTENDYLMLDIRNQNVDSKFIELEDFRDLETDAKKILLNSPRSRKIKNGDYEHLAFTKKIDNKVSTLYKHYKLDGFGDFGGLKDDLPIDGGGGGTGTALALIYCKKDNAFFSIKHDDSSIGVRGYRYVRNDVLFRRLYFDSSSACTAMKRIEQMAGTFGNWGTWNNITLTRYIQEQATK
ncbi:hypothetical protein LYSIN_00981 [Lysinibacillus sphaericus]|uniref:Uncharacterized protein n=1 Tax=Lysinibacillus sphaericus TaxID=1421 RepID=A0A2S5CZM5_LYSSH|nr:hypothetical protein [Lysinibacillus sphaericus]POZ56198.1 hypothetical protein LYSIN_00981 [Lysinibacillus sphaericus]